MPKKVKSDAETCL